MSIGLWKAWFTVADVCREWRRLCLLCIVVDYVRLCVSMCITCSHEWGMQQARKTDAVVAWLSVSVGVVIEEGAGLASAAWHPQLHCGGAKRVSMSRVRSRVMCCMSMQLRSYAVGGGAMAHRNGSECVGSNACVRRGHSPKLPSAACQLCK